MTQRDLLDNERDISKDSNLIDLESKVNPNIIKIDNKVTVSELQDLSPTIQSLVDEDLFGSLSNKEKDELRELNKLLAKNPKALERIMRWVNSKRKRK